LLRQIALFGVAQSALARHDYEEARRVLREAVALSAPIGDRVLLAQYLEALAEVAVARGDAGRAALLLGASDGLLAQVGALGYNAYDPDLSAREHRYGGARTVLGDPAFEEARELGRAMGFEQAVEYAIDEPGH
jgi:hypothetical protein